MDRCLLIISKEQTIGIVNEHRTVMGVPKARHPPPSRALHYSVERWDVILYKPGEKHRGIDVSNARRLKVRQAEKAKPKQMLEVQMLRPI